MQNHPWASILFEWFDSQELTLTFLTYVEGEGPIDFSESPKNYIICVHFWKLRMESDTVSNCYF